MVAQTVHRRRRSLLRFVFVAATVAALATLAAPAAAAPASSDVPADVAARWSRLNTKAWSVQKLKNALPLLQLPDGFDVDLYYQDGLLDNARSLALSGASKVGGPVIVFVSTKLANRTYALVDEDGDGRAERATTLFDSVDTPQGLDWRGGDLFVSGWRRGKGMVWRLPGVDQFALSGEKYPFESRAQVVTSSLPGERWHGERYMRFSPPPANGGGGGGDGGLLHISIGAPCDVCAERTSPDGVVFSSIYTLNVTDGALRLYARGLRNVVGMDWHPDRRGDLYFTTNGRDGMGDDQPDCTLAMARAEEESVPDFGFPYCHQRGRGDPYARDVGPGAPLSDPKLNPGGGSARNCSLRRSYRRPVQALGPHVAPLGMRFYRWQAGVPGAWPREEYDRAAIIAEHGSWDRSSKIGYKLKLVRVDYSDQQQQQQQPRATAHRDFVTGWVGGRPGDPKESQKSWGRPADVLQLPDGSLLVSDDGAHTVYRIAYTGKPRGPAPPLAEANQGADAKRWARAAPAASLLLASLAMLAL